MARTSQQFTSTEVEAIEQLDGTANNTVPYKNNTGDISWAALGEQSLILRSEWSTSAPTFGTVPVFAFIKADIRGSTNNPLFGETTIDGVATNNTVVFLRNQTDPKQNGVWISNVGAWTRHPWYNSDADIRWKVVLIAWGTSRQGEMSINTNTSAITVGVTNITFSPRFFLPQNVSLAISSDVSISGAKENWNRVNKVDTSAGNRIVTLPAATGSATSGNWFTFFIQKNTADVNTVTINAAGSDTINGASSITLTTQYELVTLQFDGTTDWTILSWYNKP